MYARRVADKELTFDFAEGLYKDNLLIVDRETESVWSQLHGKAILGPLEGTPLTMIPAIQSTWGFWREKHPDTRVMVVENEKGRPYFYRNRPPGSRMRRTTTHDTSTLGLGLAIGEEAMFFPFHELHRSEAPFEIELGGESVKISYQREGLTAWAEGADGALLPTVLAYKDGWVDFFPKSRTYRAP